MHKFLLYIWFLNIPLYSFTQSEWKPAYYAQYNIENFRKFEAFHQPIDIKNFDFRLANAAVFYKTNEIREKKKLNALIYNEKLEVAATFHSRDMAERKYFNHTNSKVAKRKTPNDRAKLAGISNPFAAENITEGFILDYIAGKDVYPLGPGKFSYKPNGDLLPVFTYMELAGLLLDLWMNSPPHKKNILAKDALELGCGVAIYFDHKFNDMPMVKATQLFQLYKRSEIGEIIDNF